MNLGIAKLLSSNTGSQTQPITPDMTNDAKEKAGEPEKPIEGVTNGVETAETPKEDAAAAPTSTDNNAAKTNDTAASMDETAAKVAEEAIKAVENTVEVAAAAEKIGEKADKEVEKTAEKPVTGGEEADKKPAAAENILQAKAAETIMNLPEKPTAGAKRPNETEGANADVQTGNDNAKKAKTGLHPLLAEVAATQSSTATAHNKIILTGICAHTLFETTKHNRCLLCSFRVSQDGNNSTKAKKSRFVCLQCGKAFHVNCFTVFHNLDTFAKEHPDEAAKIDREALEKYVGQTRVREKRTSADVGFKHVKLPW